TRVFCLVLFFFSSRRRHTRCYRDWSSDVCSSDLLPLLDRGALRATETQGTPSQPRHRALEREPGPGGRFVEQRREDLSLERPGTLLADGDRNHLAGGPQNQLDVGRGEVADREDVSPSEARHQVPNS